VAELGEALAGVVADSLGVTSVEVRDLVRLSGGASRESWSFDAICDGVTHELILRRAPAAISDAIGPTMMLEAAAMREAARVGVPSPHVLFATADKEPLGGSCIVMTRVAGETIARKILRDQEYAEVRPKLARQCGEILGTLHSMDVSALPTMADAYPLEGLRALLDDSGVTSPMIEASMRWLETHSRPSAANVVVHGDFRNGNLVIGADGVRAALDWELVHLGDPIEDLGWLCTRAWRFGGAGPVGGFGDYADLLAGYEATSGNRVELDALRWWELFGTVKWGVICIVQANRHLVGGQRSVELAAVGRRLVEQEYDCLNLLEELLA
jgi:aminoglycoside phosphotransferase (APT) family kinase protein